MLLSVLCAPLLFVRRSSQCDWFSRGAGALHSKGHERPLGDLAFPWRRKFKGGSSSVQKIAPFKGNFDHTDEADEPEDDDDEEDEDAEEEE